MFIVVCYKESPELARPQGGLQESDASVEKTVLVNPHCAVRVMLEFIRNKCKLGAYTNFDLCDNNGVLKKLFALPPCQYPAELFEHRHTYYIIVFKSEPNKKVDTVIPQVNSSNALYEHLRSRVQQALAASPEASASTRPLRSPSTAKKKTNRVSGKRTSLE